MQPNIITTRNAKKVTISVSDKGKSFSKIAKNIALVQRIQVKKIITLDNLTFIVIPPWNYDTISSTDNVIILIL